MKLIRHTIEFIKCKSYGYKILSQVKDEVKSVMAATQDYEICNTQKVINSNKKNIIRHAFYREYRELQHLCLLIIQHKKHQIGFGSKEIYGLLFDGAWLWEEYINSIVNDIFYHPMNKANRNAQRLFDGNRGLIYPDFISRNSEKRIIADAKYKPISNIGNKDYLQILAYMFRFDANIGLYFYPEANNEEDAVMRLNRGSTFDNNVEPRDNIGVIKYGFKIPMTAENYEQFTNEMKRSEELFRAGILAAGENSLFKQNIINKNDSN